MLSFAGALKVYLAVQPQDLRKNFNGLCALVSDHLQADPYQGGKRPAKHHYLRG